MAHTHASGALVGSVVLRLRTPTPVAVAGLLPHEAAARAPPPPRSSVHLPRPGAQLQVVREATRSPELALAVQMFPADNILQETFRARLADTFLGG